MCYSRLNLIRQDKNLPSNVHWRTTVGQQPKNELAATLHAEVWLISGPLDKAAYEKAHRGVSRNIWRENPTAPKGFTDVPVVCNDLKVVKARLTTV
ncbi:unnamed protein product [Dibothriocephalus latus]|uniref:Uncharacterized protein n=1 Tax=Dibothriocephalus latus TaxID=60516 RepID=A0A3P6SL93_DIBLA|nr:unnamed protein product [Dibothriocephalus latus]